MNSANSVKEKYKNPAAWQIEDKGNILKDKQNIYKDKQNIHKDRQNIHKDYHIYIQR